MNRFGPSRGELKLRLAISLGGMALLIGAYATNGIGGIASLEIGIIGSVFFGGSALWCLRELIRKAPPETDQAALDAAATDRKKAGLSGVPRSGA